MLDGYGARASPGDVKTMFVSSEDSSIDEGPQIL